MASGLSDTVAVVTGGGSGIGAATAARLSAEGTRVVVVDANEQGAQETAKALPGPAVPVQADVASEADVERYMAEAVEAFGRVDHYHLNAGISGSLAPFPELTTEAFDAVLAVNARGAFLGLRAAFQQYQRQDSRGAIVITASIASTRGSADLVPYHASKHAVAGLAQSGAVYGGPLGIRVNAIAPGIVPTGLLTGAAGQPGGSGDALTRARNAPLGRAGTVDEVAGLVTFLLSDDAGFMTGGLIPIDGGATATNPLRPATESAGSG